MPYRYNFKINFKQDWINKLRRELKISGYNLKGISDNDVGFSYFNLKKRLVAQIPRKVLMSREFKCDVKFKNIIKLIRSKIERGQDITPYLSEKILNLQYNDDMLNDWSIYHLHLGDTMKKDKQFIKRTNDLLFVRFDNEYAYFVNVYKHGDWTKQEIIKILHENWPDSIARFKMEGVKNIKHKFTDNQYKRLRKKHISMLVEVEKDVIYFPLGGGYMASGHSTQIIEQCDFYFGILNKYEKYVKENHNKIIKAIQQQSLYNGNKFYFYPLLEEEIDKFFVYELYSDSRIQLGPIFNNIT